MKNNNDRVFVIAILTEVLLSIIVLTCLIFYKKSTSKELAIPTQTTVIIENTTTEQTNVVDYEEEIKHKVTKLIRSISGGTCSYRDSLYIYEELEIACAKYSVPMQYALGMGAQESRFKSTAYNRKTSATGVFQICQDGLTDYNDWNGTNYTLEDMYDIKKNIEVAMWNFKQQAYYLRRQPVVMYSDCIIAYNTGVGYFKKYKDDWYKGWNPIDKTDYGYLTKVLDYSAQFVSLMRE